MLSMTQRRILIDMKKSEYYISLMLLLHLLSMIPILYYSMCRAYRARCYHSSQALARTFDAVQKKGWQWIQRIDQEVFLETNTSIQKVTIKRQQL